MSNEESLTPNADAAQQAPQIRILGQYVKDLSFENPGAPSSLRAGQESPKIDLNLGVRTKRRAEDGTYEVELDVKAHAQRDGGVAFIAELTYGGWFEFQNASAELLDVLLHVEAPRMLFPFARRIVSDATRDGGYPPLFLEPIDFGALYMAQRQKAAEQAQAAAPAAEPAENGQS